MSTLTDWGRNASSNDGSVAASNLRARFRPSTRDAASERDFAALLHLARCDGELGTALTRTELRPELVPDVEALAVSLRGVALDADHTVTIICQQVLQLSLEGSA